MTQSDSIDLADATRRLTSTSSCFAETYENLKAEWFPDAPPATIVFSSLGRAFCQAATRSSVMELTEIWSVVEELVVNGDETVKNAVTTGLLEAILSESSAGRFCMSSIFEHFGPATMSYCKAWDAFTGCKTQGIS